MKIAKEHRGIKGQAILELAVFGALLITLLGFLISYGLQYYYSQQAMQESFRRALSSAAESHLSHTPTSVDHIVVNDRHIPDPADPWGTGTVVPFIANSPAVARNQNLLETADYQDELPRVAITFGGQEYWAYNAGFREEEMVEEKSIDKYRLIYGNTVQAWNGTGWVNIDAKGVQKTDPLLDPVTGNDPPALLNKIRFMDYNAGNFINYDVANNTCKAIINEELCQEECTSGGTSFAECRKICKGNMQLPWYCQEYSEKDDEYTFPRIEQLFAATEVSKTMGLQGDQDKIAKVDNSLIKDETPEAIVTSDTLYLQDMVNRTILYLPYGSQNPEDLKERKVSSELELLWQEKTTAKTRTPW